MPGTARGAGSACSQPLERRGHRAVAVDLPGEDPAAGLDAYADTIATALAGVEDEVVVVAHSLNGLVAPLVAARRPVRALVYLAAFVPVEGESMNDQFRSSPEPILLFEERPVPDEQGRSHWPDEAVATRALYPDLDAGGRALGVRAAAAAGAGDAEGAPPGRAAARARRILRRAPTTRA